MSRVDGARGERGDPHAVRPVLVGHPLGEREQRGVDRPPGEVAPVGTAAAHPGDVDDAPPPAAAHVREHGPREAHVADELRPPGLEPLLVVDLVEDGPPHRRGVGGARVVDEDVDAAEALDHPGDEALDGGGIAEIAAARMHAGARGRAAGEARAGRLEPAGVERADGDVAPLLGEHLGRRVADAAAPAADQRHPPGDAELHAPPPPGSGLRPRAEGTPPRPSLARRRRRS